MKLPKCVFCGKRKKTRVGAFCGARCATKYGMRCAANEFWKCGACGQYVRRPFPCPNCGRRILGDV